METAAPVQFSQPNLGECIDALTDAELDRLEFGVIAFDAQYVVRLYNAFEAEYAGLSLQQVIGLPLFTDVAPCMNNFLVAQRFEDAVAEGVVLDVTLDYVLTLRMRPVKVKLRLVALPNTKVRYVFVDRRLA